jgi:NAD(P)-dependent dehydrogenase (short-subunit alcohol dehydrogenase family)
MQGRRVVVVGASSGIGRHFAVRAVKAGADVVLGARRADVLAEVVAEAGGGTALTVDVTDPASRTAFLAAAGERPIDLLLISSGHAEMRALARSDDEAWARTMAVNVVGVDRLVTAALPALSPTGVVAVLSSEAAHRPRWGLVPYAASKAALEAAVQGWRVEHRGVRVSCVVVGATFPTGMGEAFDLDELGPALEDWQRHGLLQEEMMTPEDFAGFLVDLYSAALRFPGVNIDHIVLRSPSPVAGAGAGPAV